ncbi:hypothetical protein RND81_08G043000 [Saponaria officinalis]|uniref:Oberon PHD finger domain-containing protein n=1 Tax=Saponaria officinalis TaxID=3572 RepID=A0AAW1J2B0_SAPOF
MDSSFEGAVLDPMKSSKLTMEGRREIVYELAKWSHGAAEILQTWSRQDILQILCSEMGKERKYTGLTKLKIIEQLLKVVSEKTGGDHPDIVVSERPSSPSVSQKSSKRPRKPEVPSRLLGYASTTNISSCDTDSDPGTATYCTNAACKARLNKEDVFCKRCTCCICHKYDDNKDPSIWLTCNSEPPFSGDSCNMSCHLECALKHERSGIARHGIVAQLDGSFYCVSCGKMNDLMRCWRKQLIVAKETRRVDILCYRLSLSQKLLSATRKYRKLSEIVDDAVRVLEAEVGTLSGGPVKMGRGIVNRLSSGQEVQRLCSSALESFDSIFHPPSDQDAKTISPSSNGVLHSPATNWSSLSNPSSIEDETNNNTTCSDLNHNKTEDYFNYYKTIKKTVDLTSSSASQDQIPSCGSDEEHAPRKFVSVGLSDPVKIEARLLSNGQIDQLSLPCVGPEASLPITPSRKESLEDGIKKKGGTKTVNKAKDDNGLLNEDFFLRSSSKKRRSQTQVEECVGNGPSSSNLEYYIKVVRWLECEGHIDKSFRQKFLTWYSIRATAQETRIVKAFVDTLIDDPASLSEQLVDTFGEIVSSKKSSDVPHGFCMKLWH